MAQMTFDDLANRFNYHAATTEDRKYRHDLIRNQCLELAKNFNHICPEGRELSLATTKLEEAMFWANAAIARQKEV